jgi:3'5'-cyclic nucleotide phosphodiesterase
MACHKFLQRIVAPDLDVEEIERAQKDTEEFASHLHAYTLGINSDPVTRCAIIFSALIHDADHRGVSNVQLGKEEQVMADSYAHKSIAGTKENTLHYRLQLTLLTFTTLFFDNQQNKIRWTCAGQCLCRLNTVTSDSASGQMKQTFCASVKCVSTLFLVSPGRDLAQPAALCPACSDPTTHVAVFRSHGYL